MQTPTGTWYCRFGPPPSTLGMLQFLLAALYTSSNTASALHCTPVVATSTATIICFDDIVCASLCLARGEDKLF